MIKKVNPGWRWELEALKQVIRARYEILQS